MCCFYMPARWRTARSQWAAGAKMCHLPPGHWNRATREWKRLRFAGVVPDGAVLRAVLEACRSGGAWTFAEVGRRPREINHAAAAWGGDRPSQHVRDRSRGS